MTRNGGPRIGACFILSETDLQSFLETRFRPSELPRRLFLGARLRGRTATQRSKIRVLRRVLEKCSQKGSEKGAWCALCSKKGSQKGF